MENPILFSFVFQFPTFSSVISLFFIQLRIWNDEMIPNNCKLELSLSCDEVRVIIMLYVLDFRLYERCSRFPPSSLHFGIKIGPSSSNYEALGKSGNLKLRAFNEKLK